MVNYFSILCGEMLFSPYYEMSGLLSRFDITTMNDDARGSISSNTCDCCDGND